MYRTGNRLMANIRWQEERKTGINVLWHVIYFGVDKNV
jgi:hypothetical protein